MSDLVVALIVVSTILALQAYDIYLLERMSEGVLSIFMVVFLVSSLGVNMK